LVPAIPDETDGRDLPGKRRHQAQYGLDRQYQGRDDRGGKGVGMRNGLAKQTVRLIPVRGPAWIVPGLDDSGRQISRDLPINRHSSVNMGLRDIALERECYQKK